jgi:UDP-N-acetylglucosamine acyltransferase
MKNKFIHSSAVVEPGAKVANDVIVGPFSYIGAEVTLHSGVEIKSHVVVTGMTEIDQETVIYPFAVIGEIPQDLKFNGEKTSLKIGKRNQIREM